MKFVVHILACLALYAGAPALGAPKDHEPINGDSRQQDKGGRESKGNPCPADPDSLVKSANGEAFAEDAIVTYLTNRACFDVSYLLSRNLVSQVKFQDKGPYAFDSYAKKVVTGNATTGSEVERELEEKIPGKLRAYPLTAKELVPVVSQLTLLSPPAARIALAHLIAERMYSSAENNPARVSFALVVLGADKPEIAEQMANHVEELATMVQADSLAKYFATLGFAANGDSKLVGTYNLAAGAFNRGVQRGKKVHSKEEQEELLKSLFSAIRTVARAQTSLDDGQASLNEAMDAIIADRSLKGTTLSKLWQEVLRVTALLPNQTALAGALAKSLTSEFLFLPAADLKNLLLAGGQYSELALAIQSRFFDGWNDVWEGVNTGRVRPEQFRSAKQKTFVPMVENILDFDPAMIHPVWLREVVKRDLVGDSVIEKRFPKAVLNMLVERGKSGRQLASEDLEGAIGAMARDLSLLWSLGHVYIPALNSWVDRQENGQK